MISKSTSCDNFLQMTRIPDDLLRRSLVWRNVLLVAPEIDLLSEDDVDSKNTGNSLGGINYKGYSLDRLISEVQLKEKWPIRGLLPL